MRLVMFEDALAHIARITRILRNPQVCLLFLLWGSTRGGRLVALGGEGPCVALV